MLMDKEVNKTIEKVIEAGEKAVEELIKVAEEEIITGKPEDDLAADRLKNAAATKKLAVFDAFEILQKIQKEKDKLSGKEDSSESSGKDTGFQSFAESKGRKL